METSVNERQIQDLEDRTFNESDSVEFPPPDIVAYNELRSCADLFRMFDEGILEIQPDFQRQIVWNTNDQTRFIDSLVKQLPIPSMCFSLDYKTQKWQVIDGLQRMWSIIRFLRGDEWRLSRLDDIDPALSGQPVPQFLELKSKLNAYYSTVRNLTLPLTVIRCDHSKPNHMSYLFTIFHRLNTGAMKLNNQEIRNCIFSGNFNNFLRDLDRNENWLKITGRSPEQKDRYRGQEQILRFFAFHDGYPKYREGLAAFLNQYMLKHREPSGEFLDQKRDVFQRTVNLVNNAIFDRHTGERRSISVVEATLVGVSLNLDHLESLPTDDIYGMFVELVNAEEFSDERLRGGLSSTRRVLERMSLAHRIFSGPENG